MRHLMLTTTLLLATALPGAAAAQGGNPSVAGAAYPRPEAPSAPKLPGVELEGPLDAATARTRLALSDEQATQYAQAYDSFMVAARPLRDSATAVTDKLNARLDVGDLAAARFYADRLQEFGKPLKERQDRFEDQLRRFLTGDQVKEYRRWREQRELEIETQRREDALRWRQVGIAGGRPAVEQKTFIEAPSVPKPDVGAQALRVGRTVFVSSQVAVDSAGSLVGAGDLRAQAERAFANLTAVLQAARAAPRDVVQLTIYVVDYRPEDLATIRDAAPQYFPGRNPPLTTVLGVQALVRPGLRIAVQATAVTGTAGSEPAPPRP
ncbi:MAG: RidA family protein [Gemmatimonadales bacterium]